MAHIISKVGVRTSKSIQNVLLFEDTCDALHNLVPFVQFKKHEKHPWRSDNYSKVKG